MNQRMVRVKEAIVVEGRYDRNALRQVVDALDETTEGFGIFKDAEKQVLLRSARERSRKRRSRYC